MTEEAVLADSQPAGVPPSPETVEPDGPQGTEPTSPAETEETTAAGESLTKTQLNWKALREDRDHWREMARTLTQQRTPESPKPVPQVDSKAKTLADFEYDEGKYQSYLFEQAEQRGIAAAERRLQEQETRKAAQQRLTSFKEREGKFAKTVEDYEEVAHFAPISNEIADLVTDLDEGPAVAYYLGKNPEIARKLNDLPPARAGIELGRIEARLLAEREKAKEKPVVSKAPPPTPKIEASGSGTPKVAADDPESDKLPVDEWVKSRNKQLLRRKN